MRPTLKERVILLELLDAAFKRFQHVPADPLNIECHESRALPLTEGKFGEAGAALKRYKGHTAIRLELALEAGAPTPSRPHTDVHHFMRGVLDDLAQRVKGSAVSPPAISFVPRRIDEDTGILIPAADEMGGAKARFSGHMEADSLMLGQSPDLAAVGEAIRALLDEARRAPDVTGVTAEEGRGVAPHGPTTKTQVG